MNKHDILILLWNCPECVQLKVNINYDKAFVDTASGANGQSLLLYYTFSNIGLKELLNKFDMQRYEKSPILKTFDGKIINELPKIIEYMKANY